MDKFVCKINEIEQTMKSSKKFFISLILFATMLIVLIAVILSDKNEKEDRKLNEVDYTYNILKNSDFENGDLSNWNQSFNNSSKLFAFVDDIVKYDGRHSANLTSDLDTIQVSIFQNILNYPRDKKLILNGRMRTENVKATFLSIELYSNNDSLLAVSYSDTLTGTNDWKHLTTWVRTINSELSYIVVRCNLVGKGRVWFDNLEMFPVDLEEKVFIPFRR